MCPITLRLICCLERQKKYNIEREVFITICKKATMKVVFLVD